MESRPPLLPMGQSEFERIRNEGRVYVDKTMYIPLLKDYSNVVFLARPRRFGKSLAVSTLDSFYSGEVDLFKGLAAERLMRAPSFAPRPVIRLDMSGPSGSESKKGLEESIAMELEENAQRHGVELRGSVLASTFVNLVRDVKKAKSQDAVL
jgi:hypothetical protein